MNDLEMQLDFKEAKMLHQFYRARSKLGEPGVLRSATKGKSQTGFRGESFFLWISFFFQATV